MKSKKLFWALIGLAYIFFSVSCSGKQKLDEKKSQFLYNGEPAEWLCFGGQYLYDQTKKPIKMRRLEDNVEYDFIRDPFIEEGQDGHDITHIFPGEDYLYYMENINEGSFRIVQRNYETFSEKTIYSEVYLRVQRDLFLGTVKSVPYFSHDFLNASSPMRFCVFEDVLFLFYDNRVKKVDLKTNKISTLCEKGVSGDNYAYYHGKLYFIGTDYSLYFYHIVEDRLEVFQNMKARRFLVTPKGIFYANANDGWKLYFMDFDGEERCKLTDTEVTSMDFSGEQLYYLSVREGSGHIYSMALDGGDAEILFDLPESFSLFYVGEKQTLYVLYMDSEGEFAVYPYAISSENR